MNNNEHSKKNHPTWCPGCGNFGIFAAVNQALAQIGGQPHETALIGGIGCGASLPYWSGTYGVNSLHGRPIPVATGIARTNPTLTVLVVAGDGDTYGIGMGHLIHALRRDPKMACIVCNNGVYGLTKGQASPTAALGFKGPSTPQGNESPPINPIALAISMDASFVARGYSGNVPHLKNLLIQALQHPGFAFIDVIQPCVTYNKSEDYASFQSRIKIIGPEHDTADQTMALSLALASESLPIGIFYKSKTRPKISRSPVNPIKIPQTINLADVWENLTPSKN